MKIKKLKIENFRSAKELSIELSEELNVFAGINGSGKTTVLEALIISLSWLINRIQLPLSSKYCIIKLTLFPGKQTYIPFL